ncbi:restriction endonuclease subunit S, partial [Megamonas funiformis]|uniref:restriction endonuclease subunit S n=1 Tax=Megamonas funiformis TaxID=437897 RepID=UPI00267008E2
MNIPKLRFKEFTDEWVYYKYKDIFNLNQGLQIPITERFLDYAPNRFFYITNEFLKPSSKKSYYIENPSPNVICTKEDILMTRTGNTGKVITNIAGVFHNNFFRIKYNPKNFNKDFICCILNQNKIQNKILTLAGNSTIPDLNHKDFYSIKSRFPKLKEQEKIAKFINTVDKKIENIENTISSLENQKKGLLQQIFSQKLRFKDKNGNNYPNWKENIESIKILSGNMYPTTSYINKPGILLIQGINITPNKLLLNDCIYISNDYNEINHVIVKKGDILLGLNRPLINNQLKIC